jgi:hypothetical protein
LASAVGGCFDDDDWIIVARIVCGSAAVSVVVGPSSETNDRLSAAVDGVGSRSGGSSSVVGFSAIVGSSVITGWIAGWTAGWTAGRSRLQMMLPIAADWIGLRNAAD